MFTFFRSASKTSSNTRTPAGDRFERVGTLLIVVVMTAGALWGLRFVAAAATALAAGDSAKAADTSANNSANAADAADSILESAMTDAQKLAKGLQQYSDKQYEESLATLQAVSPDGLDDVQKKQLSDTLPKVAAAAASRKDARAEFEMGQQSLNNNQPNDAMAHYRKVLDNAFADDGTRAKAREQIELAAVAAHRAGANGAVPAATPTTPAAPPPPAPAEASAPTSPSTNVVVGPAPSTPAPAASSPAPSSTPPPAPVAEVPPPPTTTAQVPPPPPPSTPPPAPTSVASNPPPAPNPPAQPAPASAVAAPAAVTTAQPATSSPAVAEATPTTGPSASAVEAAAANAPPPVSPSEARQAYYVGRDQYRKGDWISARRNLELASNGGFKPGLFEDSPQQILTRMNAKESTDAQKSAQLAAQANAMSASQPSTPNSIATPGAGSAAPSTETATTENAATTTTTVTATPSAEQELAHTAEADRLRQSQFAFESNQKVQQADEARQANRLDDALRLYTEAVTLDPNNQAAVNGRNAMMRQMGLVPGGSNALDRLQAQIEARREAVMYSFNSAMDAVHKAVDAKDYKAARAALEQARVARGLDENLFNEKEKAGFDSQIAAASQLIDSSQAHEEQVAAVDRSKQTEAELVQSEAQRKLQTQRTIASLIANSQSLIEQGNYEAALGVVKQILRLDPNNDYARGVRPLIEDRANLAEERKFREAIDSQTTKTLVGAEEAKVPYSDILLYPEDWPELSAKRDRTVAEERGDQAADEQIFAQLEKRVPELKFEQQSFADVIDYLRDVTTTNIYVNWRALEGAGIDKNTPVTIRLRDVKFSKALRTILDDVGGTNVKLAYTIDDGVITISTADDLSKNTNTRVYDIRDLIIDVPDFTDAPNFDLNQATNQSSGGGGGGQSLFSGGSGNGSNQQAGQTRTELVDAIIKLIQDTVASDSWKDNGGTVGSVKELQGQLIVTQTPENQRALVGLLEKLREQRAIQVTIEARFLLVQRNYLEDIGVDFNFAWNIKNPGASTGNGFGPISVSQSSYNFTDPTVPANLNTGLPGSIAADPSFANNLSTGITYLDDFSVNLLIRATEDTVTTHSVTAPRITLFNGEHSYIVVATQTAYVSNLTPIVSTGVIGFQPTPATVQDGVKLELTATVSADRKYVTLVLEPQLAQLLSLVNFPVGAVAGGGTTVGPNGEIVASSSSTQGFLQQPTLQITELKTTVSVPDGGTLLLGGQTLAAEIEREAGVPILSKIPFLKRLFTNRSMSKDDQVLLILVKPTIIIEREKEAEQFPLLTSR